MPRGCNAHPPLSPRLALLDHPPLLAGIPLPAAPLRHRFLLVDETGRFVAAEIDDVRSIHVRRRPSPANCVALADQSSSRSLLFLDLPPTGGKTPAQLRLVDDLSLDLLATLPLRTAEFPLSVVSAPLYQLPAPPKEEQVPFFVIGTAFVLPSESEPTSGRLLICRVECSMECSMECSENRSMDILVIIL